MTIKELEKEIKQLKKELQVQSNKWNKLTAYASVALAITSTFNVVVTLLIYFKK